MKLAIVVAIMKKPEILLLDEVFVVLDPDSVYRSQQAIRKYLPEALVLVVDYHAENNNFKSPNGAYDMFYNGGRLHLADKKIVLVDLEAKGFSNECTCLNAIP